jgi:hypothetical protein
MLSQDGGRTERLDAGLFPPDRSLDKALAPPQKNWTTA